MGMFDTISGRLECPYCHMETKFEDQVKWADCLLRDLHVGSEIYEHISDGEITWATYARPELKCKCQHCGKEFKYKVIIKDNKINRFDYESKI